MSNEMKDWMRDNEIETGDPFCSSRCPDNYEVLKNMTIDEMAKFLGSFCHWENTPWERWLSENFCDKCRAVEVEQDDRVLTYARCELEDENYPCMCGNLYRETTEKIIRAWLTF